MRRSLTSLHYPSLIKKEILIGGKWVSSALDQRYTIHNPSTGNPLASIADAGTEDTKQAIQVAHESFMQGPWTQTYTAKQRSRVLRQWYDLIQKHAHDLATLVTLENGKPFAEALGEVQYGASFVEWFSEEAKRQYGYLIPTPVPGRRLMTLRQPVGVCALITPWNFPVAMITRKLAPALAAGCTVLIKPSPETPLSALALGVLAEEAGVPPGVIQILPSSLSNTPGVGRCLLEDRRVRKVSLTGSTVVGKLIYQQASASVKRLSLELGGNAPFIVFPPVSNLSADAFLDRAVDALVAAKLRNSGQTCISPNRIFIHDSIHDDFVCRLKARVDQIKVGDGFEEGTQMGPLISRAAVDKVERHIQDAIQRGAQLVTGGPMHGQFYRPTILTGCRPDNMLVGCEETFGPILSVFRFQTEDQVVQLANAVEVGLAGYFFSQDLGQAWRVAERLEVGMVGVNESAISTEVAPFGGVKESGLGREGSMYGLDEYTNVKYICMNP